MTATVVVGSGDPSALRAKHYCPVSCWIPSRFSPLWPYAVAAPVALLCISALSVLWIRRRSVLDLWLMVVMCLY